MEVSLYTDGGSRGNPGPGAAGIYIVTPNGKEYVFGFYLGVVTNNQAEYYALRLGLEQVKSLSMMMDGAKLLIYMDSELVVKQMRGEYKIKDSGLSLIQRSIQPLIHEFPMVEFKHIPREDNSVADGAVNSVLDLQDGIKSTT